MVKMDPDAALDKLRRAMADEDNGIPLEVYEAFTGLDNWLSRGGFLPSAWVPEMGRERKDTPMG